jgi:hypothetical protein
LVHNEEYDIQTSSHRGNGTVTLHFSGKMDFLFPEVVNEEEKVSTAGNS